jgi:uncharacterized protein (TIGR02147 family)
MQREVLLAELARRQANNPRYSLRSFARALGVSPGFLSKVLNGHRSLSASTAHAIAQCLGFSSSETSAFLAEATDAEAMRARDAQDPESFVSLSLDTFAVVSDWHHYAILELTQCEGFRSSAAYISYRLGITETSALSAITRLLRLGLLEEVEGKWLKTDRFLSTGSDTASAALRNHHTQMLELAKRALESQGVFEREISSFTLSLNPAILPRLKGEIRSFMKRLVRLTEQHPPTEVFQFGMQLFRLSRPEPTPPVPRQRILPAPFPEETP